MTMTTNFNLIPSMAKDATDKTFGKFQAVKEGTKYRKLMKNGKTRFSKATGGMELWLTKDEIFQGSYNYGELNNGN